MGSIIEKIFKLGRKKPKSLLEQFLMESHRKEESCRKEPELKLKIEKVSRLILSLLIILFSVSTFYGLYQILILGKAKEALFLVQALGIITVCIVGIIVGILIAFWD
jgi:hypothetical protein